MKAFFACALGKSKSSRVLLAATVLSLTGCAKSCKSQPYVPYAIGDEVGEGAGEGGIEASVTASTLSPSAVKALTLGGKVYQAPEGGGLRAALSDDVDLDGKADAVFVVEKDKRLYLALFREGAFQELASDASVTISNPALCDVSASLVALGGGAFASDLRAACGTSESERPNRHVSIFLPQKGALPTKTTIRLGLSEARAEPPLSVVPEAVDVDGDGTRDVRVTLKATVPAADLRPEAVPTASLVWLDRPTGLSASLSEPESSLRASLDALRTRPSDPSALAGGEALRVLYGAMCGTRPRVLSPRVRCDAAVGRVLAETEAFVGAVHAAQKNVNLALATFERAEAEQLLPVSALRDQFAQAIRAKAPPFAAKTSRVFEMKTSCAPSPAIGPLTYLGSGHVHLQGTDGSFDFDPATGDRDPGTDGPGAAEAPIVSDKKEHLLEVYDPCDGRSLRASIMNAAGNETRDLLLPIGGAVAGCGKDVKRSVRLLGQEGGAVHLLVAGAPVSLDASFSKAEALRALKASSGGSGTARSPNGSAHAVPTALGVLVQNAGTSRLWTNPSLPPARDLCQCTVRNDAKQIACASPTRVYVVE